MNIEKRLEVAALADLDDEMPRTLLNLALEVVAIGRIVVRDDRLTSLAVLRHQTRHASLDGVSALCGTPLGSFVLTFPLDMAALTCDDCVALLDEEACG